MSEEHSTVNNSNSNFKDSEYGIKEDDVILYPKRWIILFLFISYSFLNAYQWIHLNIISEKVTYFWNNSLPADTLTRDEVINWLSLVYMISYIPLIIPAMWFLKHKGLRSSSLIAAFLNALGAWIKCAAVSSDGTRFAVLLGGQTICAIAQIFILGIPAELAAVWFGADEVSTATSLGVFGNQLGIGFGFVIPPLLFTSTNQTVEIYQSRFNIMFYTGAAIMTLICIIMYFVFDDSPPTPPSLGQKSIVESSPEFNYKTSLSALFRNWDFVSLFISYGINTGIFYSISTILNSILQYYFKDESALIGTSGLVLIVSGIVASVIIGVILDKTKAFKACIVIVYLFSMLSMISFMGGLLLDSWVAVFATMTLLGFFMTGYLPLGFEIAAEITYPINAGLTSGLLNLSAQVIGIIFTYVGSIILQKYGAIFTNISFCACLGIGLILTGFMKIDSKRMRANLTDAESDDIKVLSKESINQMNS